MIKRIILLAGIVGISLIVILSAAIIPYFGKIKSTINILPPEIGVDVPATEEDCRNESWENLMTLGVRFFDNESDCINYVQTYMCENFEFLTGYPDEFNDYDSCINYFGNEDTNSTGTNDTNTTDENNTTTGDTNFTGTNDINTTDENNTTTGDTNSTETGGE